MLARPRFGPGIAVEPSPSPWRFAVSSLLTAISLGEVASRMPEGEAKGELARQVEAAVSAFIDGCGTNPPGWWPPWLGPFPFPWPGPDPGPGPWPYLIASELAAAANTIADGYVRNEILRVAGQIIERASGSIKKTDVKIPTHDEIVAMTAFPSNQDECDALCEDFRDALRELQGATGRRRQWLLARLRALHDRMRELKCRPCLPI